MSKKSEPKVSIEKEVAAVRNLTKEFKEFISRGNVVDLAVGVIIGGAFGKIVSSLVSDIILPLIGILLGGADLSALAFYIGDARIAYEYRVAKVSSDRGIVGPLLGANDSFDLKVSQAADKATCVVRIEHVCAPSI